MRRQCPVCHKPLSEREYEKALGILGAREQHLRHQREALQVRLKEAKKREAAAFQEGAHKERSRTRRLLIGQEHKIRRLEERVKQLQRGTTPQTDGLEFEEVLVDRLQKEFPEDEVIHKGKGGDILHRVKVASSVAGVIVYECKRMPGISTSHVRQAARARRQRDADFAVLVTTGRRRGFAGFMQMNDVLVVSPLGVVALAALLRQSLIEMLKARVARSRRNEIADRIMAFVSGPQFKNPIEQVVSAGEQLFHLLKQEMKDHARVWTRRKDHYEAITWDASLIRNNVQLVLGGKVPRDATALKRPALRLPAIVGSEVH